MEIRDHKYYQNLNKSIWKDKDSFDFRCGIGMMAFFGILLFILYYINPNFKEMPNTIGFCIIGFMFFMMTVGTIIAYFELKSKRGGK